MTTPPLPTIAGLTSDMPAGGYPPGTKTATVTAQISLASPGPVQVNVGLPANPLTNSALVLNVKSPIVVPVGATLSTLAWPDGTKRDAIYQDWAAQFGMPMAGKVYLHTYPTSVGQDGQLRTCADLGITPVICFGHMNYTDLNADVAAFTASIKYLATVFKTAWVVFEQEPNNGEHLTASNPAWNAQAFAALSQKYYPIVKANSPFPVLFCPSTGGTYQSVANWYPGPKGCDGIAPDHYCGIKGSAAAMPAFTSAAQIVARDGLTAGVGWLEIGISASLAQPAPAVVTQLVTDAVAFFIERKQAGLVCAPFCWWNGPMAGSPGRNTIWPKTFNPANNYMIPVWQNAVKSIAAA